MLKGGSRRSQSPTCWVVGELKMNRAKEESAKKTCREDESVASESWLPDQFYFTKSFPGLQQLYCVLKHTDDGCCQWISSTMFTSSCQRRSRLYTHWSCAFHSVQRPRCRWMCLPQIMLTNWTWMIKKKTLLRGCVMTKCQPTGGRSGGERPPGFWPKTIKINSNLNPRLHRVCVAATL